jgi:hypothetical protein
VLIITNGLAERLVTDIFFGKSIKILSWDSLNECLCIYWRIFLM